MKIDAFGRLRWTPTLGQITTTTPHKVTVTVSDDNGGSKLHEFNITVAADTIKPQATLIANTDSAKVGSEVTFLAKATDNIKVASLQLLVNGTVVQLDPNGMAKVKMTQTGNISAIAKATDTALNEGQSATWNVLVTNPNPNNPPPNISLNLSNIPNGIVTAPTNIIGTVSDDNLINYILEVAPLAGGEFKTIGSGTTTVSNNVLGKFDPSLLQNDTYRLRLSAYDANGNGRVVEETIDVAGELKLGNFRLSFTDLTVPVTGIPITLTRTYDTLTANTTDDFGYGWRMEFRDTDLRTSVAPPDELQKELGVWNPFKENTRVYITLPGGKREGFTFKPKQVQQLDDTPLLNFAKYIYTPEFVADAGVTNKLSVEFGGFMTPGKDTPGYYGFAGNAFNPADPYFGGKYKLTTKEGRVYEIDANTGDLLKVTDTNGNTLTYTDDAVTISDGQKITFERDAQGRIASVKDPMSYLIKYDYDAKGDLIAVTDRENNTTKMEYGSKKLHYLDKIIDPLGRTGVKTEYWDDGRIKQIIGADGKPVQMAYDPANSVQTVQDQLGNLTIYEYDTRGNIVTEIDAEGKIAKRKYKDDNNLFEETVISDRSDPNPNDNIQIGFTTQYKYDALGNRLSEEVGIVTRYITDATGKKIVEQQPSGYKTTYTYGKNSRLLTETDPLGRTTINTYDDKGNLLNTTDASGKTTNYGYNLRGQLLKVTDALQQTTRFTYDKSGNVATVTDALDKVTAYTYNNNGDKLTETRTRTTPTGVQTLLTQWTYDKEGHLRTMTDAENRTTTYEYDKLGRQTAVIDALARRTEYVYNEKGELVETIYPDNTSTTKDDNPRIKTKYDAAGRQIETIDQLGRVTRYIYDKVGELRFTVYPDKTPDDQNLSPQLWDNPKTETIYYTDGLVKAQIDELGNRTEFRYDAAGRQTEIIYADDTPANQLDNPKTTYKYDKVGQRISETDALNHTTTFVYDDLGRLKETRFHGHRYITQEYDALGRRIAAIDQNRKPTEYRYDALGQLTGVKNAFGDWTEYGYNEVGNLIWMEDALDRRTNYEYDKLGRRTAVIQPMGQRSDTTYDAVGNLKTYTDFNRRTITYDYDPQNRMTSKLFGDGSKVTYTYTNTGLQDVVKFINASSVTTATYDSDYDERDRLIQRTDNIGGVNRSISYTYDAASNRTSVTTPSGTVNYTFDRRNRLDKVIENNIVTADYDYDGVSNLVLTKFANGTQEIRHYDDLNRLQSLENKKASGEIISSYTYTLDAVGNRTKVVEHNGRSVDYTYDDLYRLTQEKITDTVNGNRIYDYTYDKVGNRKTKKEAVNGVTTLTEYAYDNNDRLQNEKVNQVAIATYTYDNNGNTLTKTENGMTTTYTWDYENRLGAATLKNSSGVVLQSMQYRYNDNGIRVASVVNNQETRYLIDTVQPYGQVLEEYSPNGAVQVSYTYGNDLISQKQGTKSTYYHVDGLGSTRALTDASGNVVNTYNYEAYGELLNSTSSVSNKYMFAGEQYDSALGDYYLRQRYYDTETGRFTRRDTYEGKLLEPITLHKYIYTNDNPVNFTDPTGLFSLTEISSIQKIQSILDAIDTISFVTDFLNAGEEILKDYVVLNLPTGIDITQGVLDFFSNFGPQDYILRALVYGGGIPVPKALVREVLQRMPSWYRGPRRIPILGGGSPFTSPYSILSLFFEQSRWNRLPLPPTVLGIPTRRILGSDRLLRIVGRVHQLAAIGLLAYDVYSIVNYLNNSEK
ncbi:RHS repeat-associated core domain-containing protein [Scytonema sp. UIC 10036]|uniref:RHS repeat-associated core domain-containing protein n=1 Tax=Scytonema sp. UIC 10036 TaxID=2304196 RepID=UPI001FAB2F28|nr:RHS repeat-associated core domain-containing protein [Scytonema sp. UIC 10036]